MQEPAAIHFDGWILKNSIASTCRARRTPRRARSAWRRTLFRLFANFSLGVFLLGCTNVPRSEPVQFVTTLRDRPVVALQNAETSDERVRAYMKLAHPSGLTPNGRRQALELLTEAAANEKSALLRSSAVAALANYDDEALPAIHRAAKDDEPMVRVEACRAMHRHGDDTTIQLLKRLATLDANVDVRIAAAESIAHWDSQDVQDTLVECVSDEDPVVARVAGQALRDMTGMDLGIDHDAWVAYFNGDAPPQPPVNPVANRHGLLKKFVR